MQFLLLETLLLIPNNIHASGKKEGKHNRKPSSINLLCLIKNIIVLGWLSREMSWHPIMPAAGTGSYSPGRHCYAA